jgi:hypothetical protein
MKRLWTFVLIFGLQIFSGLAQEAQKKPEPQAPAAQEEQKPDPLQAEPLPTLDQIIEKFIEGSGGKAAMEKLTSRVTKGTFEIPSMGANGALEGYAKAPNKSFMTIDIQGLGVMQQSYDGTVGWEDNPMAGFRELSGTELAARKRDADFYQALHFREHYPQMTVKSKEKVGERTAFLVEATPAEGKPEKLYFDAESGLIARSDVEREGVQGSVAVTTYMEDYREVDGIKIPFLIRQVTPMFEILVKLAEVKHNVEIEDAKFAKPAPKQ